MDWFISFWWAIVLVIVVLIIIAKGIYVVPQQQIAIIERLGKFHKAADAGFHIKIPIIDRIAGKPSLRVFQLDNDIPTKTKDNVFANIYVAVQYRINKSNVVDAWYQLDNPVAQITAYVEDAIRASIPTLTLDDTFEMKDDIANKVQETISEEMEKYGYTIIKALITSIEPGQSIKDAMNGINEANRRRVAAQELAEADKITVVVRAEAEAKEAELRGQGIAAQRQAIVDGLAASVEQLTKTGLSEDQVMGVLLTNQYLDSLNKFADKGNSTIFLPAGPEGAENIRTQLLSALRANAQGEVTEK
jgi:regulator of protease activity HflC (stomatin/prohibitin superfamily)